MRLGFLVILIFVLEFYFDPEKAKNDLKVVLISVACVIIIFYILVTVTWFFRKKDDE